MSVYTRLSHLLITAHKEIDDAIFAIQDTRHRAATLAQRAFRETVLPEHINIAALALAQQRLSVHSLKSSAAQQVLETDVRTLPADPPRLLQEGWVIEAIDHTQPLFDDIACMGGYQLDGKHYMICMGWPDGIAIFAWNPRWGDSDIEGSLMDNDSYLVESELELYKSLQPEAIRFALTFAALLEAEGTPLESSARVRREPVQKNPAHSVPPRPLDWVIRTITLTKSPPRIAAASHAPPAKKGDAADSQVQLRTVRGHLKRQPYGPNASLRKWIYIEQFERLQHVSLKPLRIVVKGAQQSSRGND